MKLHRSTAYLDGRAYTLITPRPSTSITFAVNHFHDTWHVLSGQAGARMFARLLWGLAYQRHADTLVLLDRRFLDPTPFEAEPSPPIVLVPTDRTAFGGRAARDLRRVLHRPPPSQGTVRAHSHGLDAALADPERWWRENPDRSYNPYAWRHKRKEHESPHAGLLVLPGDTRSLLADAVLIGGLHTSVGTPMDYVHLDRYEFQVFHDYRRRVSAARTARAEIDALAAPPDTTIGTPWADPVRQHIWARGTEIRERRMRGRRVRTRPALYSTPPLDGIRPSGPPSTERQPKATA
jgi:hypothetical protein